MATKKKLLEAAAGAAGGAGGLNVEEVFSTYLYTGNGSTQTITNDIDLAGEGGLVWGKMRSGIDNHNLFDTERGATSCLFTDQTNAQSTVAGLGVTAFNADGFNVAGSRLNASGSTYASWTFRKAPKFFDVVTWTGNSGTRTISHNLNGNVGTIIIKKTSGTGNWYVIHRAASGGFDGWGKLNLTDAFSSTGSAISNVTSTSFDIGTFYNNTGVEWVAYLFAHNDGDGDFGPTADQDIIKCGSFTTDASANFDVDLGFEPQFILVKRTDNSQNWVIHDNMRGITDSSLSRLHPNLSDAEGTLSDDYLNLTANGFKSGTVGYFGTNAPVIYIAIRRPTGIPESASEVFAIDDKGAGGVATDPAHNSGFVVDMALRRQVNVPTNMFNSARLISGKWLYTNTNNAESGSTQPVFDYMDGFRNVASVDTEDLAWMWKRAPSFFDVVAYTGNGVAGRTVSHNLGVAPEMIWAKRRNDTSSWYVYYKHDATTYRKMYLEQTSAYSNLSIGDFNNTLPTDSVITLGAGGVNDSGFTYIAYLFASLDGVSKVGSFNGSLSDQTIDCGFTNGARFVLIKKISSTGGWFLFDTERGIVSGNDPRLYLDTIDAEVTSVDYLIPHSSGFTLVGDAAVNSNTASYIFYAIA